MGLTVELNPETQARLAAEADAQGIDLSIYAAHLLEEAVSHPAAVRQDGRTGEEIRAWLDRLAQFSDSIPSMPGETFSREMIYRERD